MNFAFDAEVVERTFTQNVKIDLPLSDAKLPSKVCFKDKLFLFLSCLRVLTASAPLQCKVTVPSASEMRAD